MTATNTQTKPDRWRFLFAGVERTNCRQEVLPVIAHGPYPEALADAKDRAADLMIRPTLVNATLLTFPKQ